MKVELNFQNELFNCTTCKALDTKEIENTFVLCLPHCVENLDTIITYSDNPNIKCDGIGIVTTVEIRMIILKWMHQSERKQTIGQYSPCKQINVYKIIGISSTETCQCFYLPELSTIFLYGPVIGRISGYGKDNTGMGWWCYVKLNGTNVKMTWFISAYRVIHNLHGGVDTTYYQQLWILTKQGILNPQHQKQWDTDFISFFLHIPSQDDIVIGIEANTSLQDTKLTTITHTLSLCDLITAKYGQNTPLTHSRGRKTIDHILTSHQISSTTQNCGILPFYKFFDSHHRGIYADLPNKITSGGLNYPMQERRKMEITNISSTIIHEYKKDLSFALWNISLYMNSVKEVFCLVFQIFHMQLICTLEQKPPQRAWQYGCSRGLG